MSKEIMKTARGVMLLTMGLILSADNICARPVDLSTPSGGVGSSNSRGYLEIWREIDDVGIDFGKGSYLPLRYKFASDPGTGGILGLGFYCPMFEARNFLVREQMMRAFLPCGKGLYLGRDNIDLNKFQTVDQEWTGLLKGDDFTITRNDGWSIYYHQGRLTSITTDEHHVFIWDYDANTHMATGISEDGKSLVTVEPNQQGLVDALVFDGKRYEFGYSERPLIEMLLGQPVIKQLTIALSSFKYPDGKTETFKFALTPERVPMVTFTDPDQKQTLYTWDAATSHIATEKGSEGTWTYDIGKIAREFGLPPITRTSSDGKTEGMAVDTKTGTFASLAFDGVTTVTHTFETPGPLYHKIKSIEKTTNGITTTIYKASYDETGRLIREINEKGFTTTYTYSPNQSDKVISEQILRPHDPLILSALHAKENILIAALTKALDQSSRDDALQDLGFFYVHEMGDSVKAMALLPQVHDRLVAFNIKAHAIDGNLDLSPSQRIDELSALEAEFPEQKELMDSVINTRKDQAAQANSN